MASIVVERFTVGFNVPVGDKGEGDVSPVTDASKSSNSEWDIVEDEGVDDNTEPLSSPWFERDINNSSNDRLVLLLLLLLLDSCSSTWAGKLKFGNP